MTIAVSIKVHDGLVLATDSASTLMGRGPNDQSGVVNIYNNASKICNLYKGKPVGLMTRGAGSIGTASISTLGKDLRDLLMGSDPAWKLPDLMEEVASRAKAFFEGKFSELPADTLRGDVSFLIGGYSLNPALAEEWLLEFHDGKATKEPALIRPAEAAGAAWWAQPEAIHRLIFGTSVSMPQVLTTLGLPANQVEPAFLAMRQSLEVPFVRAPMPIQDAIDLAEFLVHLTCMWSRFVGPAPSVGGPIEIAAITKHERFKWVQRKHYFSSELNPA